MCRGDLGKGEGLEITPNRVRTYMYAYIYIYTHKTTGLCDVLLLLLFGDVNGKPTAAVVIFFLINHNVVALYIDTRIIRCTTRIHVIFRAG